MHKLDRFLTAPYYFQWLIVFFALHGYSEFVGDIGLLSLLVLILKISATAWALFWITNKLYKNKYKAALCTTAVLFLYLFFGVIQDWLLYNKTLTALSYIRYFVLLNIGVALVVFIALFFYKKPLTRFTKLLNCLFLIYILYDVVTISWKQGTMEKKVAPIAASLTPVPDTVARPDIYLILLDEYLGTEGLKEYLHYDNTPFESFLQQKGFYVCHQPRSNYSYTVYSMSSLFSMGYVDSLINTSDNVYKRMTAIINNNSTWASLNQLHYSVRNFSPFVVQGQQPPVSFNLVPFGIDLITDKTAWNRIVKRMPFGDLLTDLQLHTLSKYLYKDINDGNERLMASVLADTAHTTPSFTYLHLMLPHRPYLFDSTGQWSFLKQYNADKGAAKDSMYLNYLVYTNKRISRFIDQLNQQTHGNAVILLLSDHGYRTKSGGYNDRIRYMNFNAVYLPNRDYRLWNDSVSNVNEFPLLFNTLFGQQLPLQKDAIRY